MRRGGPRRVAATGMAATGVAAALVLGTLGVEDPATVIPLTLELIFLAAVTWAFLSRARDPKLFRWLAVLTLVAIALRVAVLAGVHLVLSEAFFAPDAATYWGEGRVLAQYWHGLGPEPTLKLGTQVVYPYLNGVFFYLLGDSTFGVVVINLFAGIWTMLLTFAIGREVMDERVGKVGAILVAFFPSMVLWSVLNIRDSITTFAVTLTVYFGLRMYREARPRELLGVVLGIACLTGLRDYMGFLVMAGLIVGAVTVLRPGRIGTSLALGTVLTLILVFAMERLHLFQRVVTQSPLQQAQQLRRGLQTSFQGGMAGSAFGLNAQTNTIGGALRFLPLGLAYILFAPFPWAISSPLQLFTLPEVLLWYGLIPFTALGVWRAGKAARRHVFVVLAVLLVVLASYALVEGNVGTAYRHRAQVMPLIFLFTAVGLVRAFDRWREARSRREGRRRKARASLRRGVP